MLPGRWRIWNDKITITILPFLYPPTCLSQLHVWSITESQAHNWHLDWPWPESMSWPWPETIWLLPASSRSYGIHPKKAPQCGTVWSFWLLWEFKYMCTCIISIFIPTRTTNFKIKFLFVSSFNVIYSNDSTLSLCNIR